MFKTPVDAEMAKTVYEILAKTKTTLTLVPSGERAPRWEELDFACITSLTTALSDLRAHLQMLEIERQQRLLVESVETAWKHMTIESTEESAAWYTIRDWLNEMKKGKQ